MQSKLISRCSGGMVGGLICLLIALGHGDAATPQHVERAPNEDSVVELPEARRRAELLHNVFESTLYSMHRNYFKPDKQMPIPSRALEGVFYSVSRRSGVEVRWLAVNAQAMSIDHKPKDPFERAAVKSLRRGQKWYEEVAEGEYRRAGAITLFSECIKCHTSSIPNPVAALVIRVPFGNGPR